MSKYLLLAFLAITPSLLLAAEPEKLIKLKSSYQSAISRVTDPIQKTYLQELEKLKAEYTRAAKLEDALAVDSEIRNITSRDGTVGTGTSASAASVIPPPPPKSALVTPKKPTESTDKDLCATSPAPGPNNTVMPPWSVNNGSNCLQVNISPDGVLDLGDSGYLQLCQDFKPDKLSKTLAFFCEARLGIQAKLTFYTKDGKDERLLTVNGTWSELIETPARYNSATLTLFITASSNKGMKLPTVELRKPKQ